MSSSSAFRTGSLPGNLSGEITTELRHTARPCYAGGASENARATKSAANDTANDARHLLRKIDEFFPSVYLSVDAGGFNVCRRVYVRYGGRSNRAAGGLTGRRRTLLISPPRTRRAKCTRSLVVKVVPGFKTPVVSISRAGLRRRGLRAP